MHIRDAINSVLVMLVGLLPPRMTAIIADIPTIVIGTGNGLTVLRIRANMQPLLPDFRSNRRPSWSVVEKYLHP